ncbi:hypothetical protein [uncultured Eubacterium sp.]|nr:hypothetical protein [uncultured Eubacterium sp.]
MSYIKFLKHGKRMGVVAVAGLLALAPVSLNITVRQSRQSGVARATCPD